MSEKEEGVKISAAGITLLLSSIEPYYYRVDSLIEDHYTGLQSYTDDTMITLMDLRVNLQILVTYLRDLCEQAEEEKVNSLFLRAEEVRTIAQLSKSVSVAAAIQIGNTNLKDQ